MLIWMSYLLLFWVDCVKYKLKLKFTFKSHQLYLKDKNR